jgi:hypothetical protein
MLRRLFDWSILLETMELIVPLLIAIDWLPISADTSRELFAFMRLDCSIVYCSMIELSLILNCKANDAILKLAFRNISFLSAPSFSLSSVSSSSMPAINSSSSWESSVSSFLEEKNENSPFFDFFSDSLICTL